MAEINIYKISCCKTRELFLKEHPQVFNEVNKKVREYYQISKPETNKKPEGSK